MTLRARVAKLEEWYQMKCSGAIRELRETYERTRRLESLEEHVGITLTGVRCANLRLLVDRVAALENPACEKCGQTVKAKP